ncbi:hypothetical protein KC726_01415 [Candidatus Woesebacteria bacterium]|nr:hypothetical protein [Candidatus Woesebacteria bacterium]
MVILHMFWKTPKLEKKYHFAVVDVQKIPNIIATVRTIKKRKARAETVLSAEETTQHHVVAVKTNVHAIAVKKKIDPLTFYPSGINYMHIV